MVYASFKNVVYVFDYTSFLVRMKINLIQSFRTPAEDRIAIELYDAVSTGSHYCAALMHEDSCVVYIPVFGDEK